MMSQHNDEIFEQPYAYDIAFSWDLKDELSFFESIFKNCRHLLIPACGTGRYASGLAKLGYQITAFDIQPNMLHYALSFRKHPFIKYRLGDMTDMSDHKANGYDGALLLNNSLRYILDRSQAVQHFNHLYRVLRPGGSYLIEVGLNDNCALEGGSTHWSVTRGDVTAVAHWRLIKYAPPHLVDHVKITLKDEDGETSIEDHQTQLIWSFDEIRSTVTESGFLLRAVFNHKRQPVFLKSAEIQKPGKFYLHLLKEEK